MTDENKHGFHIPKLGIKRVMSWCVLSLERFWPRIFPYFLIWIFLATLSWFGLFNYLGFWTHIFVIVLFVVGAIASLFLLSSFRFPKRLEIDRHIEAQSGLKNQPIEAQTDKLADIGDNPLARALWLEHQKRMAETLKDLHSGVPNANMPKRDPFALRAVVLLLAIVGFAFSFGAKGGRFIDVFDFRAPVDLSLMRVDAWVTPPLYTNEAPIYLTKANIDQLSVAEGSKVNVQVVDGGGAVLKTVSEVNGKTTYIDPKADKKTSKVQTASFEATLDQSMVLSLSARHYQKDWHFNITKDTPPTIRLTKEPDRILEGSLELNYAVDDDYGVTRAFVEIRQIVKNKTETHALYGAPEMKLLVPRGGKGEGRTVQDLSNHPWAGSEVEITLVAEDGAGHQARSESRTITLPQRNFGKPLARAIIEQRRMLTLDTMQRERVLDMLSALQLRPKDTNETATEVLALSSVWTRLSLANTDDQFRDVVNYMWQIALGIEGDNVDQAKSRLKQAQAALRDALRNGASPEQIERLTNELRKAMNDYIAALSNRAKNSDQQKKLSDNAKNLKPGELEDQLKQLEDMAKTGNRPAAEQLLSEIESLLDNLQIKQGDGDNGQAGNQNDEMQKQMNRLGEIMRRQQEALNDTHSLEDKKNRNELSPEDLQNQMDDLKKKQDQLQSDLNQLQKDLKGSGVKPSEDLKSAEEKMGKSGQALGKGDGDASKKDQADALSGLRKGAQDLMKQMQDAMKKNGESNDNANQDPLGHKSGSSGVSDGESDKMPTESQMQRAQRILDEIRKRLGNSFTPEMEKEYLERLLKFN